MPTVGPNAPGTLADSNAVGTVAWNNPSNAGADDGSYANTAAMSASQITHYLKATNFGFAISDNSMTVTDIIVGVKGHAELAAGTTLVSQWPLNESTGSTIHDVIGGLDLGQDNAQPWWWDTDTPGTVAGPDGCLKFNNVSTVAAGSGSLGSLPLSSAARSITFWYKLDTTHSQVSFTYGSATGKTFSVARSGSVATVMAEGISGLTASASSADVVGSWHLFTFTLASDGKTWKLYLDGSLDASGTLVSAINTQSGGTNIVNLIGGVSDYTEARIKDLRVYSTVLDATAAATLYTAGSMVDYRVRLVVGGIVQTEDKAAGAWTSTDQTRNYSGWGSLPSIAQINDSGFGVAIAAQAAMDGIPFVDYITITVVYRSLGSNARHLMKGGFLGGRGVIT